MARNRRARTLKGDQRGEPKRGRPGSNWGDACVGGASLDLAELGFTSPGTIAGNSIVDREGPPIRSKVEPQTRFLGAIAWISTFQFFVAQVVVQLAWRTPFSLRRNYISDLGNTVCAPFPPGSDMLVCSPWHAGMNASFALTGVLLVLGAALLRHAKHGMLWKSGLALVALAGVGFVLVATFPENVRAAPHRFGAALHFVGGNLGLILLGAVLLGSRARSRWATLTIATGALGLLATALFVTGHDLGAGHGGMERLAAYPVPLWTTVAGVGLAREARAHVRGLRSSS